MTKKILCPLLLLSLPFLARAESRDKIFPLTNFSAGLDSYHSSLTIGDNNVKNCLNVYFDKDNAVQKRKGYSLWGTVSTGAVMGSWWFTDTSNQSWIIIRTSTAIYASPASGSFTVQIATLTSTCGPVTEVNAQNKAYFVNRIDGVFNWNGTTTTYVSGSPLGRYITEFHGRLWVGGADNPNQNVLYGSQYLNGSTWTVGNLATDSVQLTIGLNDNADGISGMFSGINDTLYVFKTLSINGVYGFDQTDFATRILTRDAGCIDYGSIQPYQGALVFLSRRGLEQFDGVTTRRISDNVKDKIDSCIGNSISGLTIRTFTQTTASDFGSGFYSGDISSTALSGSIVTLSSYSQVTSSTDWGAGTTSGFYGYIDTQTFPGQLRPLWPETFDIDRSTYLFNGNAMWAEVNNSVGGSCFFSISGSSLSMSQNSSGATGSACLFGQGSISNTMSSGSTFYWKIENFYDAGGSASQDSVGISTTIPSSNFFSSGGVWFVRGWRILLNPCFVQGTTRGVSIDQANTKGDSLGSLSCIQTPADLSLYLNSSNYRTTLGTSSVTGTHTYPTSLGAYGFVAISAFNDSSTTVNISQYGIAPETFTWTANTLDTGIRAPIWFSSATTSGDSLLTSSASVSADGITFDNGVVLTTTSLPNPKRYIKVQQWFNVTHATQSPGVMYDYTIQAGASGTYTSPIQTDPLISGWSPFTANVINNGGTQNFYVRSDTWSFLNTSTFPAWVAVAISATPSAQAKAFFQVRDDFAGSSPGPSLLPAELDDFTLRWNQGVLRPNAASIIDDERYWLSCSTTSNGTFNDSVIVYSNRSSPSFSFFDINAGSFLYYNGNWYHGDSNSNGNIYLDNQGYNDNGRAINGFFSTKDYAPDTLIKDKQFEDFYLQSDAAGNYSINTSYSLDRSTNSYALDVVSQNEMPGLISMDLPFGQGVTNPVLGRTISFTISNSVVDQPFNIYGGYLIYKPKALIRNLGK